MRGAVRIGVVLAFCVASTHAPRVPLAAAGALIAAGLVGLGAVRLEIAAETVAQYRRDTATVLLRLAGFCQSLTVALFLLALLYAFHPL